MLAKPSQTITLRYKSPFRDTGLFPQAVIYEAGSDAAASGSPVNLAASAVDTSLYTNTFTCPSAEGAYTIVYIPFTDSGRTVKSDVEGDIIENLEIRADRHVAAASFGGEGIMESDIKAIIDGVVKKIKEPVLKAMEKIKLQERDVNLNPILKAINNIPVAESFDDSKLNEAMVRIERKIVPVNLTSLKQTIDRIDTQSIKKDLEELKGREFPVYDDGKVIKAVADLGEKIKEPDMSYMEGCMDRVETLMAQINRDMMAMPEHTNQAKAEMAGEMLKLGRMMAEHKEMMFKMDELQKVRFGKLIETLRQMGFLSSVNIKEAFAEFQRANMLME